jgi:TctA family transporter
LTAPLRRSIETDTYVENQDWQRLLVWGLQEPISLGFLIAAVGLLLVVAMPAIRKTRDEAMQE